MSENRLFQGLVIFSSNKTPSVEAEQKISGAQTQMLARFAIGILHETWKLISTRSLGSQIGKEFAPSAQSGRSGGSVGTEKTLQGL